MIGPERREFSVLAGVAPISGRNCQIGVVSDSRSFVYACIDCLLIHIRFLKALTISILAAPPPITSVKLSNGMTVLVEPMPWLRTAAFSLSLHAGVQAEPLQCGGLGSLVCEMVQRGAGPYSSRDLVAVQDNLGIDRNSSVSTSTVSFSAAMPADSLHEALRIYSETVRHPHLPSDQLDDAKQMSLQELRAIEDEPTQRVMLRLRELQYGPLLGRTAHGTSESVEATTISQVREFYESHYHAGGSILAVAGRVQTEQVLQWAEELFGGMKSGKPITQGKPAGKSVYEHIEAPSSQTHIAFSFDSLPYGHPDYFKRRAAVGILSDGMSSRLFDRVREKRGLCYTITANCHSLQQGGGVFVYAGTTPERAQETLDVAIREIENLADDLEQGELDRWKVRVESSLIMEQESSHSKASSMASDQLQLGRVMTTAEIEAIIESLTVEGICNEWRRDPPKNFRIVTLGEKPLQVPPS